MESVSFDTLTFDHPAAAKPARVNGTLHLPMQADRAFPCMVLLTSSAGVQRHREHYYAQALNAAGVAAFIIDSFTGRGVRRTVADQTLVSGAQMEGDAFAALALLRSDKRIDPARIGVMGVSKGGGATLNAAIAVRQRWRRGFEQLFDLHVAICPGATSQHRDPATHGRPIFLMLAGRDDYTPAPLALSYAERMRAAGNRQVKVKVYSGAHHGWESLGPVFDIRDAENWSCCKNFIEDDGNHFVVAAGRAMPEPEYQAWARIHCITRGARAGGGTAELKARATADLLAFLSSHGFGVAKQPQAAAIRGGDIVSA
jgi:dienelactone hydrolase